MIKEFPRPSIGVVRLFFSLNLLSFLSFLLFIYTQISINMLLIQSSFYEVIALSSFFFFSFLYFILICTFKRIIFSRSTFFLLIFIAYVAFRSLIDFDNFSYFLEYTVRSNGGILLFTSMGVCFFYQQNFLYSINQKKSAGDILSIYLIIALFLVLISIIQIFQNLENELFLIDVLVGRYQKPADMMIILVLSTIILMLNHSRKSEKTNFLNESIIIILGILTMLASQAFGSNTGFVAILFLMLNYLFFKIFKDSKIAKTKFNLSMPKNTNFGIFSKSFLSSAFYQFNFFIFFFIFAGIILLTYFSDYLYLLRVFAYGDFSSYDSITSRLDQISNFFPQFAINPFFGNLASDSLSTGEGTYPHSFWLSLLTHLGIFGFLLFLLFLIFYIKNLTRVQSDKIFMVAENKKYKYALITTAFALIIYSSIATFFTWPPIWFFIGCTLNAFYFINYETEFKNNSLK